ncbi:MAG TPA: hypothetical protein ENJ35_00780 [Gammaproteobacteria bacterium]|nr:hypothetical protein [Gammaproteobacteria bacterium]
MRKNRKERLKALGADALADALLDLAPQHEIVDDRVNNMISLPDKRDFVQCLACCRDWENMTVIR